MYTHDQKQMLSIYVLQNVYTKLLNIQRFTVSRTENVSNADVFF